MLFLSFFYNLNLIISHMFDWLKDDGKCFGHFEDSFPTSRTPQPNRGHWWRAWWKNNGQQKIQVRALSAWYQSSHTFKSTLLPYYQFSELILSFFYVGFNSLIFVTRGFLFCVLCFRRLFPSKISPAFNIPNIPDLHPKVTYCFSEGSTVSYYSSWTINTNMFQTNVGERWHFLQKSFAYSDFLGPQWHVTVPPREFCWWAGNTVMWTEWEREQAEVWARCEEDFKENSQHRLSLSEVDLSTLARCTDTVLPHGCSKTQCLWWL